MSTFHGTINNWSLQHRHGNMCVVGVTLDHPGKEDGTGICTSAVRVVDHYTESVVTVNGSRYHLGTVDPAYERSYPNARNRLFHIAAGDGLRNNG